MTTHRQHGRARLVMVLVAVMFASLIGFVSPAQAVVNQADTAIKAGNTFYAYVAAGERMRVIWGGTQKASVLGENGTNVFIGADGYTGRAGQSGVWRVTLPKESGTGHGFGYDISVRNGTTEKKGRIWVYEDLIYQRAKFDGFQNLNYFGVSDEGYVYKITMHKMNGIDSKIALRSTGAALDSKCNVESRSFESAKNLDCGDKYRLFFEDPRNSGLPQTAKMGNSTVPVLPNLVTSSQLKGATKATFTPNSDKIGGSFFVTTHAGFSGTAELQIDTNNNGSYTDSVDVKQTVVVNKGKAAPWVWNGKNASGADVKNGGSARVVINKSGEAHLLLIDVETFGGLTMSRLNGESPNSTIFWDDRQLTERRATGTPSKSCLNGCNSNVSNGLHGWSRGTALPGDTESSSWGDGRIIDNWAYASVDATSPAIAIPALNTLKFDGAGGSISGVTSIIRTSGFAWGTLPTATLANNDFKGWFTAKTGGTQITASTLANGNITAYAQWTPTARTLKFDANGGKISGVTSITKPHGTAWGALPTATLANNDFQGWFTAKSGGTQVTASTVAAGNITVYAQWKSTQRTMTFDANGGKINGVTSITKPHGTAWGALPTATLANNDFQGWFTAKTGGTQVTASTVANGNITVYAQWKPTARTMTFDATGGKINGAASITKPHGSAWGTLPTATLENNDFQGWFTAKTGGTQVTAATVAAGNITVYAQWKPTPRTMTFDANGGKISGAVSITKPHGSAWGALPTATLANNDFQGWFTAKTGGTQVTASTVANGNITVYAQWKPTPRTLTFDATGGTINGVTSITTPHGSPWGTLPTASANAKVFLGWYTATTGGSQVTASTVATGNITVYAQWRPAKFNVVFDGNAQMGTVTGSTPSASFDSGCTDCMLPANGFTKSTGAPQLIDRDEETTEVNSTFLGWSLDPDSRTGDIADRAVAGNLSQTDGATVRLYAIWDDAPQFIVEDYPDRFFGLAQAQAGAVTEEELLRTVKAKDRETNPLAPKTRAQVLSSGSDVGVTLFDYDASDYTSLTDYAVVTATYKVKDEAGHVAFLRIRVTVSDEAPQGKSPVHYLRGISSQYADKDEAAGGLPGQSLWRTDPTRQAALTKALDGSAATTYCLDAAAVAELRTQVGGGLGNSETPEGLAASKQVLREKGSC